MRLVGSVGAPVKVDPAPMEEVLAEGHTACMKFEIEPYQLAGGKWALTLTRLSEFGTDEQPFHGGPTFDSEQDALLYGVKWVASRGGRVRNTLLQRVMR